MTATITRQPLTVTTPSVEQAQEGLEAAQLALRSLKRQAATGEGTVTAAALRDAQGEVEMAHLRLEGAQRWQEDAPQRDALAAIEQAKALLLLVRKRETERQRLMQRLKMATDEYNDHLLQDRRHINDAAALLRQHAAHLPEGRVAIGQAAVHVDDVGACLHAFAQPPLLLGAYEIPTPTPQPAPTGPSCVDTVSGRSYDAHCYAPIDNPFEAGRYRGGVQCYGCGKKLTQAEYAAFRPAH